MSRGWRLAGMIWLAGCGGGGTGPGDQMGGESVSLSADRLSLVPGQGAQITATITGGSVTTATYRSSNTSVLTVSSSGAVTAHAAGTAKVTATAGTGTANLSFTVAEGGVVTAAGGTVTAYAGSVQLVVPAGAVSQETVLFVGLGGGPPSDPSSAVNGVVQIAPDAVTFAQPATLRIRYLPANAPRGVTRSGMGMRRLVSNAWVDIPGSGLTTEDAVQSTITTGGFYSAGRLIPTTPCTAPEDRAFDFWIGSWNVSVGSPRVQIATSEITMEPGGCAILEHYTDFGGTVGRSINLRDANGMWHQTYADNLGTRIGLTGSVSGASSITMIDAPGEASFQRWSWIGAPDGTVRQIAEATGNGGTTFGPAFFDGLYTRR